MKPLALTFLITLGCLLLPLAVHRLARWRTRRRAARLTGTPWDSLRYVKSMDAPPRPFTAADVALITRLVVAAGDAVDRPTFLALDDLAGRIAARATPAP